MAAISLTASVHRTLEGRVLFITCVEDLHGSGGVCMGGRGAGRVGVGVCDMARVLEPGPIFGDCLVHERFLRVLQTDRRVLYYTI